MLFFRNQLVNPRTDAVGFGNLRPMCTCTHAHLQPVAMPLAYRGLTNKGAPMLVYRCPWVNCGQEYRYAQDFMTGQPRLLWTRFS